MKIQDILQKKDIIIDLDPSDKDQLLSRMARFLASVHDLNDADRIEREIFERESAMSTGIGFGVAIPHARLESIDSVHLVVARCADGVEFEAIDDLPVHLIFMMVSPRNTSSAHTQVLSAISRIMQNKDVRERLLTAHDADGFLNLIIEGENRYVD